MDLRNDALSPMVVWLLSEQGVLDVVLGEDDVAIQSEEKFGVEVAIPDEAVKQLPAAIDLVSRREKVILDVARAPGFTSAHMREALQRAGEIH